MANQTTKMFSLNLKLDIDYGPYITVRTNKTHSLTCLEGKMFFLHSLYVNLFRILYGIIIFRCQMEDVLSYHCFVQCFFHLICKY